MPIGHITCCCCPFTPPAAVLSTCNCTPQTPHTLRYTSATLQVSIVAFKKGQMEVLAHAWDRSLGGRDLDNALTAHFADEFKAKTGLDINENAKARYRMKTQVEKARQTLTINPKVPINVECLMEDMDFRCALLGSV